MKYLRFLLTTASPLFFLMILGVVLLFFRLGETTLTNWDEAWFASVAQDMVLRGDWLKPRWNGEPWFYEPPLLTWILASIMSAFGKSELVLRSFNAVAGLAIVILTYLLAQVLFNKSTSILHSIEAKAKGRLASIFSALVILSNIEFLFRSRQINTDIPLALFLLISLYSAYRASNNSRWLLISMASLALAFLTKRASALLAVPALLFILLRRKNKINVRDVLFGLGLFMLILLPWYGYSLLAYGDEFIRRFVIGYTLGKITSVNPATGTSVLFYLQALKHAFKLWVFPLPFALIWFSYKALKNWRYGIVLIFVLSFFVALTIAPIKSSWFFIPAYPLLAIVIGSFLAWLASLSPGLKLRQTIVTLTVFAVFAFQVIHWRDSFIVPDTTRHQVKIVQKTKTLTQPEDTIYLDDDYLPVAVYYSGRKVVPLRFNRQLKQNQAPIDLPTGSFVLSNNETMGELAARASQSLMKVGAYRDLFIARVQ